MIIKLSKVKENFESSKRKVIHYIQRNPCKTISGFFSRNHADQKEYIQSTEKKKKRLLTKNILSAKTVHQKWEVDTFPDKEMLKELTTSRPVLQEMFKVNPSK